jgi:hypothetical protein
MGVCDVHPDVSFLPHTSTSSHACRPSVSASGARPDLYGDRASRLRALVCAVTLDAGGRRLRAAPGTCVAQRWHPLAPGAADEGDIGDEGRATAHTSPAAPWAGVSTRAAHPWGRNRQPRAGHHRPRTAGGQRPSRTHVPQAREFFCPRIPFSFQCARCCHGMPSLCPGPLRVARRSGTGRWRRSGPPQ